MSPIFLQTSRPTRWFNYGSYSGANFKNIRSNFRISGSNFKRSELCPLKGARLYLLVVCYIQSRRHPQIQLASDRWVPSLNVKLLRTKSTHARAPTLTSGRGLNRSFQFRKYLENIKRKKINTEIYTFGPQCPLEDNIHTTPPHLVQVSH